ncbi:MAG: beta-lactamase [Verrucomicrobiales bacterium]|nr:beta-lactamase [Verrucomicrobiales bacterium]
MLKIPKITETEWEIMRLIWTKHPITSGELIDQLSAQDRSWHPKTARTLLGRLVKKGALKYEPLGRSYVYEPLVTEEECIGSASESFLDRVFGGSLQPMLAYFVKNQKLTKQDFKELGEILEGREKPQNKRGKK